MVRREHDARVPEHLDHLGEHRLVGVGRDEGIDLGKGRLDALVAMGELLGRRRGIPAVGGIDPHAIGLDAERPIQVPGRSPASRPFAPRTTDSTFDERGSDTTTSSLIRARAAGNKLSASCTADLIKADGT